jgi:CRISPR-associated protein Csd1
MILQELHNLYQRLASDPDSGVSLKNYSRVLVSFYLVLSTEGRLISLIDQREKGKAVKMTLPEAVVKTSGPKSNFLWESMEYILGYSPNLDPKTRLRFDDFKRLHHAVCDGCDDPGARAVLTFIDHWEPEKTPEHPVLQPYLEALSSAGFIVLALEHEGRIEPIFERPAVRELWKRHKEVSDSDFRGQCLITGIKDTQIARVHPKISGVRGGNPTGGSIVGVNASGFYSYGKSGNYTSPIGEAAAFAYTTALNWMLERGNPRHLGIADSTIVFWADRKCAAEDWLGITIDPPPDAADEGQDNSQINDVRHVLREAREGRLSRETLKRLDGDPDTRVYVLGLAPNSARISVRFWETAKLGHLVEKIGRHYADIALQRSERDEELPRPGFILKETAAQGKWENIPPLLSGQLMQAIFNGTSYPMSLYSALLCRIRAERQVNYLRAAMIKGILVRNFPNPNKEILTMALNETTTDVAYRLGRLFCVLENLQRRAVNPQATIKDRYFGAASATPGSVFPQLLRNAQNHIGKEGWGDNELQEILSSIDAIPSHLDLQAQGRFILGYYHQRQDGFAKAEARKLEKAREE